MEPPTPIGVNTAPPKNWVALLVALPPEKMSSKTLLPANVKPADGTPSNACFAFWAPAKHTLLAEAA
jgi:hypothetical protein